MQRDVTTDAGQYLSPLQTGDVTSAPSKRGFGGALFFPEASNTARIEEQ